MSEFERNPAHVGLFEKTETDIINLFLRIQERPIERFNHAHQGIIKFKDLASKINGKDFDCAVFKTKESTEKNNITQATNTKVSFSIYIDISTAETLEVVTEIFFDKYSFRVHKATVLPYKKSFTKEAYIFKGRVTFVSYDDEIINFNSFQQFYSSISKLPLTKKEINKEKDKKIWDTYVKALKLEVKSKEQLWKIKDISRISYEDNQEGIRSAYLDIYINEENIKESFKDNLFRIFKKQEVNEYNIDDKKAFLEFNTYRVLNSSELEMAKQAAVEHFYTLADEPTVDLLKGHIDFITHDEQSIKKVHNDINICLEEYMLSNVVDNNGNVTIEEEYLPVLKRIVEDKFKNIVSLEINTDQEIPFTLNVSHNYEEKVQALKHIYPEANVKINKPDDVIEVEISAFLNIAKLNDLGLVLENIKAGFKPNRLDRNVSIQGVVTEGYTYYFYTKDPSSVNQKLNEIKAAYKNEYIRRTPTVYRLKPVTEIPKSELINFKLKAERFENIKIDIINKKIKIICDGRNMFEKKIQELSETFQNLILDNHTYKPKAVLKVLTNSESKRQIILAKVQNSIQAFKKDLFDDVFSKYKRYYFEFSFTSEDRREEFKNTIEDACKPFEGLIELKYEDEFGKTELRFIKNEKLEIEKDRKVKQDIRNALFVFYKENQIEDYKEQLIKSKEARMPEGIRVGKLINKTKNKLRFRLENEFVQRLETENKLLNIDEADLTQGYLKPTFFGESVSIDRLVKAMKKVTDPNYKSGYPANPNLSNFIFDGSEAKEFLIDFEEEKKSITKNLLDKNLKNNPKQLEAVTKAVTAKELAVIQGPPGTGKTTVIAEIIWQTLVRNPYHKILITSQTNLAVDNALERLKGKKLVRPLRIGDEEKMEEEGRVYSKVRIEDWLRNKINGDEPTESSENAVGVWIESLKENSSSEEMFKAAVDKWKVGLSRKGSNIKQLFTDSYLNNVNVIAATCSICGSRPFLNTCQELFGVINRNKEPEFDLVIMDEASKATPPEMILPLTLGKKVVIIGDHKQLPPMIGEEDFQEVLEKMDAKELVADWESEDFKKSQFEKLFKSAPEGCVTTLDTQFRMHKNIMDLINNFYLDELADGLKCGIEAYQDIEDFSVKASRYHGLNLEPFLNKDTHCIWVNVDTPETKVGTSYENDGEIKAIDKVIQCLQASEGWERYMSNMKREEDKEIGVITFYGPQMFRITDLIYGHLSKQQRKEFEKYKYDNRYMLPFRINTVDKFQGMERNIIIISTVRSNRGIKISESGRKEEYSNNVPGKKLGFAKEMQRVNVAFSRAKRLIIVIGNRKHFSSDQKYKEPISLMHQVDISQLENL